jgi:hypothetical protein
VQGVALDRQKADSRKRARCTGEVRCETCARFASMSPVD